MKPVLAALGLLALVACGADGEPIQPSVGTNVGIGSNGVSASTGVTVRQGPFSMGWGVGL